MADPSQEERCHQVVSARPLRERREYAGGSPSAEERYAVEICCTIGRLVRKYDKCSVMT
jgi:hypothetical protein